VDKCCCVPLPWVGFLITQTYIVLFLYPCTWNVIYFKVRDVKQVNDKAIASAADWMNANFVADDGTNIMHPLSEVWHFEQP
jgi:hypothetical protein